MTCGRCEGRNEACAECGGRGRVRVEGCIRQQVDPAAWTLLKACARAEGGKWPNGGGWLDETAAFLNATDWVRCERAAVEAELSQAK